MWDRGFWLGLPESEIRRCGILQGDVTGRFALFRLELELPEPGSLTVDVSANSRYRLWVNGVSVSSGPCKGDLHRCCYETADVSEHLRAGKNVLAAQVLYMDHYASVHQQDQRAGIQSVLTPGGGHRLAVEGQVRDGEGHILADVTTGAAPWRVYLDGSRYLTSGPATECLGAVMETVDFAMVPHRWRETGFDGSTWAEPRPLEPVGPDGFMERVGLLRRFQMKERPIPLLYETPGEFVKTVRSASGALVLDAGEETSGYPVFRLRGAPGSRVRVTYIEKFTGDGIRKDDAVNGRCSGIRDGLIMSGETVTFEPFWYRTFRFIAVETDGDAGLVSASYRETGYPLEVESHVESSAPWVAVVWDMCGRTLRRCMNETYMDCPYYEQNQFPMDTRLQALFCSCVSRDTRLTMKALEDLHCSITPDGLVQGRYPGSYQQIMSTFSLHYIFMLEEAWRATGDIGPLRRYLPDLDRILAYYHSRIGPEGFVGRLGYWEFVDWHPKRAEYGGVPGALTKGPSTIINLMYAQAWAVLDGLVSGDEARDILRRAMEDRYVLRVSFSTSYEWFRALEMCGLYGCTQADMARWAALPGQGNTTCPETPEDSRSECHGWSALPIYEFARVMAGVREERGRVTVSPELSYLPDLRGKVVTNAGTVEFDYTLGSGGLTGSLRAPRGVVLRPDRTENINLLRGEVK